ncbi:MAG: hypothetical protein KAI26_04210 [Nanoarchaeota archaeon]|nr:hypothetical protein [Nanoarchaeota archaeon]
MKYDTVKQKYLDLRNRLAQINGYLSGVIEYSIMKDGTYYTNDLGKPLLHALESKYRDRDLIEQMIFDIESKYTNYMEWLK